MPIWIRTDSDNLELTNAAEPPSHGDWIAQSEAVRIIREYNARAAREEQTFGVEAPPMSQAQIEEIAVGLIAGRYKVTWAVSWEAGSLRMEIRFPAPQGAPEAAPEAPDAVLTAEMLDYYSMDLDHQGHFRRGFQFSAELRRDPEAIPYGIPQAAHLDAQGGGIEAGPGERELGDDEVILESDALLREDGTSRSSYSGCHGSTPKKVRTLCNNPKIRFFRRVPPSEALAQTQAEVEFPRVVAWPTEEHPCLTEPRSLPGSGPQLAEAIRVIQDGAQAKAAPTVMPKLTENDVQRYVCDGTDVPLADIHVGSPGWAISRVTTISPDRVAGPGQVVVDAAECLRLLDAIDEMQVAYATGSEEIVHRKSQAVVLYRHALDAIRAQREGSQG
jgi:hypothetical protein